MSKAPLIEFLLRGIPEEFLLIFSTFAFTKRAISMKKYLLSGILFAVIAYGIKLLPIQYGINTILNLIVLIILMSTINKIEIIKCIQAGIIAMILEFICEGVNVFLIQFILGKDMNSVLSNPTLKTLYGIPSLFMFACIVIIYYYRSLKRKELVYTSNGEVDK